MFILLCSRQQTRLIAGVVLLCVSSSAFAVEYTFRQVVDLTGLVNHIYGPSLNDQGATAFTAFLPDGSYAMFATTPAGQLLTIASNAQGYYGLDPSSGGFPSINNSNTIAFAASTGEYPFRAIYRSFSFGEPIVFQQISSEPGGLQGLQEPWISNSNAIVYRASIAPSESMGRAGLGNTGIVAASHSFSG